MSYDLISIQPSHSKPSTDKHRPIFDHQGQLLLEDDEVTIWQGSAKSFKGSRRVDGSWRETWSLQASADVIVTNQRIVYVCREKVAAGQVRFSWPTTVTGQRADARSSCVLISCSDNEGLVRLEMEVGAHSSNTIAPMLAQHIAKYRIGHHGWKGLSSEDQMRLAKEAEGPVGVVKNNGKMRVFTLPGSLGIK